jgi:hypothetical protein
MGSFSWIGSVVHYFEMRIKLMEEIQNHPIPLVSNWAINNIQYLQRDILDEKNREAEMRLR